MKTNKLNFRILRNDEHFQFNTEFLNLVVETKPETLKVVTQFDAYRQLYKQEDEALKKIMKSTITEDIQAADQRRDLTFRGLTNTNKAALNHFRTEVVAAAKRLQIVFDTYGNLAKKPLNEETSAIYNLLQELNGTYATEIVTVGLTSWLKELEANNKALELLMRNRYKETAQRTDLVLKEVRTQVDTAYRIIVERIDALLLIESSKVYENFIRQLNVIVEKYNNIIVQRQGRSKKKVEQ